MNWTDGTEEVYFDPAHQTIRQTGPFAYAASAESIVLKEAEMISNQRVSGLVTIRLAPAAGVLVFDTGPAPVTKDPVSGRYRIPGAFIGNLGSFNGSYSLITGGRTYSGEFAYNLTAPNVPYPAYGFVSSDGYPDSITLTSPGNTPGIYNPPQNPIVDFTAANGYHLQLQLGYYSGGSLPWVEAFSPQLPSTLIAVAVPEPDSIAGICFILSILLHRIRR